MIVVFTREDELDEDSLWNYIESKESLKELIKNIGSRRCCTFNNKADKKQRELQVFKLLDAIELLMMESPEPYFEPLKMESSGVQGCGNGVTYEGDTLCGSKKRQPQITGPDCDPDMPELRVLLMGKRGVGKSAAGNSILGKQVFKTQFSEKQRVTKAFASHSRVWQGKKVLIIDSPEISSWKLDESAVKNHTFPGPHAFLLVTPLGSSLKSDDDVFSIIKRIFGEKFTKFTIVLFTRKEDFEENIMKYMIVLFTRKEDLGDGDLHDYTNNTKNKALKKILKKCNGRVCAFNNKETGEDQETQVKGLLKIANSLKEL